jgi:hypothetical protein
MNQGQTIKDEFGVSQIYADGRGSNWVMHMQNPTSDGRSSNPEASGNMPRFSQQRDGSWNISGNTYGKQEIRWAVLAGNGWSNPTAHTPTVQKRGYMLAPSDWRDAEMTAYYRINKLGRGRHNGGPHIEHVMRGQRSTNDTSPSYGGASPSCANNYHCNAYPDGRFKYEKDMDHRTHYSNVRTVGGRSVNSTGHPHWQTGKWFGLKTITYNQGTGVRIETWFDQDGTDNWKIVHFMNDENNWKLPEADIVKRDCGTEGTPAITWGGPLCVFRSDNIESYDIKNASIRSIVPARVYNI